MKLKYYLRGLGIGILVTTVILMIAFARHPKELTDAEVIARAKTLGMVMENKETGQSIPKATEQQTEAVAGVNTEQQVEGAAGVNTEQQTEGAAGANTEQQMVELAVVQGDTSNSVAARLYAAGVVEDAEAFNSFLMEHNYADAILPGTVQIPADADYEKIAQILINPR